MQLVGSAQAGSLQSFRVIAALQGGTGSVRKESAVEFIASYLRHDIHDGAAGCRFSHAAQDRKVDFLGGPDVGNIERDAHPLIAHAQALHMDLAFVAASGMGLKDTEDGALNAAHIVALHVERGHERCQAVILPSRRNRSDHIVLQSLLSLRALGVDDWSFAGNRDRLLQTADAQLRIDRRDEGPRKLDAIARDGCEPGQCERDGVCAGPQIDDAIPASLVGHSRTELLNQCWTFRFDRYARQHRTRRIGDDTGHSRSRLGRRNCRHEKKKNCPHQKPSQCTHGFPPE